MDPRKCDLSDLHDRLNFTKFCEKRIEDRVTEMSSAQEKTNESGTKNGKITNCLFIKIRKTPSFGEDTYGCLRCGDNVEVLGVVDGYHKIRTSSGEVGYVMSCYVKEE